MVSQLTIRADGSRSVGTGHLQRCLALATAWERTVGTRPRFLTDGKGVELVPDLARYDLRLVESEAMATEIIGGLDPCSDVLLVDHYGVHEELERQWRPHVGCLVVLDDLRRLHCCDLLIDPTLGRKPEDYAGKLPVDGKLLLGPDYALLRPAFAVAREESLRRRRDLPTAADPQPLSLLIAFGGGDMSAWTNGALRNVLTLPAGQVGAVVVLPGAGAVDSTLLADPRVTVLPPSANIAELMVTADIAIGAAGSMSWERCSLGLPGLAVVLAENQRDIAAALEASGAAVYLGDGLSALERVPAQLTALWRQPHELRRRAERAAAVCDGGGADRVVKALLSFAADRAGGSALR